MKGLLNDKVQAQSLVDAVAARLEKAIISGMFEPGSRLSEQALAKSLGVSRGPLREAIRRLEGRKLLQRTPNIGVRVATLSFEDLGEILQVQEALQGLACRLAAKNMEDSEIAALHELLDKHKKQTSVKAASRNDQESLDLDLDFHFRIATGSGNKRLTEMLFEDVSYLIWVYRYRYGSATVLRNRWTEALHDHKEIVAALERRDPVAAEQKMRQHIRNGRVYMEEHMTDGLGNGTRDKSKSGAPHKIEHAKKRVLAVKPTVSRQLTNTGAKTTPKRARSRI